MKKLFKLFTLFTIISIFIGCTTNQIEEEKEITSLNDTKSDKVEVERLYDSHHYFVEKITINDTLVNYVLVGFNRKGMVKLN